MYDLHYINFQSNKNIIKKNKIKTNKDDCQRLIDV